MVDPSSARAEIQEITSKVQISAEGSRQVRKGETSTTSNQTKAVRLRAESGYRPAIQSGDRSIRLSLTHYIPLDGEGTDSNTVAQINTNLAAETRTEKIQWATYGSYSRWRNYDDALELFSERDPSGVEVQRAAGSSLSISKSLTRRLSLLASAKAAEQSGYGAGHQWGSEWGAGYAHLPNLTSRLAAQWGVQKSSRSLTHLRSLYYSIAWTVDETSSWISTIGTSQSWSDPKIVRTSGTGSIEYAETYRSTRARIYAKRGVIPREITNLNVYANEVGGEIQTSPQVDEEATVAARWTQEFMTLDPNEPEDKSERSSILLGYNWYFGEVIPTINPQKSDTVRLSVGRESGMLVNSYQRTTFAAQYSKVF